MSYFDIILWICLSALIVALFITIFRFIYGPTTMDRVVTYDLMTANLVSIIGLYSMITDNPMFLDIALILALIGFLSIIAFAYYIRKRNSP